MNNKWSTDPLQLGEPRSAASRPSNLVLACSAEAIDTFLLVFVGTAVASAAVLGKSTAGPAYDSLAVALAFGLVLMRPSLFGQPTVTVPMSTHTWVHRRR